MCIYAIREEILIFAQIEYESSASYPHKISAQSIVLRDTDDESLGNFRLYPREFIASFIGPAIRRTFYLTVTLERRLAIAPLQENRVFNKRTSWNAMKNMFL